MDNLILANFTDEFFNISLDVIKSQKNQTHGIFLLKTTLKELGYSDSFIKAVIKRLKKRNKIL